MHHIVRHYLHAWGCPLQLCSQVASPQCGSRCLLLALGWLLAHCGVFQRALDSLQIGPELQSLLPPYHEDSYYSDSATQSAAVACAAARAEIEAIASPAPYSGGGSPPSPGDGGYQRTPRPRTAPDRGRSSPPDWSAVQVLARRSQMLYGKLRLRLNFLMSLMECQRTVRHHIHEAQQQHLAGQPPGPKGEVNSHTFACVYLFVCFTKRRLLGPLLFEPSTKCRLCWCAGQ